MLLYADYRIEDDMSADGHEIVFTCADIVGKDPNDGQPLYLCGDVAAQRTSDWDYATKFSIRFTNTGMAELRIDYAMRLGGTGGVTRFTALILKLLELAHSRLQDASDEGFLAGVTPVMEASYAEAEKV